MNIDELFDLELKKVAAKQRTSTAAKAIAKLRPHCIPPVRKLPEPLIDSLVVFFITTQCRCGACFYTPEYGGQTFVKRKLDKNDSQWDYVPERRYAHRGELPRRTEHRFIAIPHCPRCRADKSYLDDDFLKRAFDIHSPEQLSLDYDKWAYPAATFALMVI